MILLEVNGARQEVQAPPMARLIDVLRESLGLMGTKEGCGEGECGSCTVLLNGLPVNACLVAIGQCDGGSVVTVEGISELDAKGSIGTQNPIGAIGQCMIDGGGAQCGICTPGMMVSVHYLLSRNDSPDEFAVREAIAGNLCRCTGYQRIVDSVLDAARLVRSRREESGR